MAFNPPGGKGKGPGNGNARKNFTPETARTLGRPARSKNQMLIARAQELMAADDSLRFLKAKTMAWEELYPDEAAEKDRERKLKAMLSVASEDALEAMHEIVEDKTHKDRASTARALFEHKMGKAKQAVELTGKDGGALEVKEIRRVIVDPRDPNT